MARLSVLLLVVAAATAPLASAVPATAAGSGVVAVGDTHDSSTSPRCDLDFAVTGTTNASEVTALHARGTWSCPGLDTQVLPSVALDDQTLFDPVEASVPGQPVPGMPYVNTGTRSVGFRTDAAQPAASGSINLDYTHPKTAHPYRATFDLAFPNLGGPSLQSSNNCSPGARGDGWYCHFEQNVVVQLAPEVGPPVATAPVARSLTLAATDGTSCRLDLTVAMSGPVQLAYAGAIPKSSCTIPGARISTAQTLGYAERREAGPPITRGENQCWYCPSADSSSGAVPVTSGQQYTLTYYVMLDVGGAVFSSLPPQCALGGLSWSGHGEIFCELSASVTAPPHGDPLAAADVIVNRPPVDGLLQVCLSSQSLHPDPACLAI
jgi:hypothetical protein